MAQEILNLTSMTLVRLKISVFCNTREDRSITQDVKTLHKLVGEAGKWTKYIFRKDDLAAINTAASSVRTMHYALTFKWDEGQSLLPVHGKAGYEKAINAGIEAFDSKVEEFLADYKGAIERAKEMHNGTFDSKEYPTKELMKQAFKIRYLFEPVPKANHFIETFAGAALENVKQELEEQNSARLKQVVEEVWTRVLVPIDKMADVLADPSQRFWDTLVDNVRDAIALAPAPESIRDSGLRQALDIVRQKFATLNPDNLRESKVLRKETAKAAEAFVKAFGSFGNRKIIAQARDQRSEQKTQKTAKKK